MGGVPVIPEHDAADIEHDIRILEGLAKKLRAQRFENGTLSLDSLKLKFKLDENGLPADCGPSERSDANSLVEEVRSGDNSPHPTKHRKYFQLMLLSNIAAAQHIAVHLPEQALLRRHDTPIERRLVSCNTCSLLFVPSLSHVECIQGSG